MKTEKNIFIAFILNLCFSVFEFLGGILIGSVAILSDAVHDLGDAASIGLSFFFERKSKKQPDAEYTYGYARYSVLGGIISTSILLFGSLFVIFHAVERLIEPISIRYDGMILFAAAGVLVNGAAAFFTRHGHSVNQKAVNLHMLEDVLGWLVVLVGAIVIKITDFVWLDPVLSIGVSVFILANAVKNLKEVADIFLEKVPRNVCVEQIRARIQNLEGVTDVHHIHVRTADGYFNYATMHVVTNAEPSEIKQKIREILENYAIQHVTLELEKEGEQCFERVCKKNC